MGGGGGNSGGLSESPPSTASPSPAFNSNLSNQSSRNNSFSLNPSGRQQSSERNNSSSIEIQIQRNNFSSSSSSSVTNGAGYNNSSILSAINNTSSMLENSVERGSNGVRGQQEDQRLTWLQKQQRKLQERREEQQKSHSESSFLIKELKTSLQRARSGGTETTDGYASDVNSLCQYSETSRESSPAKQGLSVPLHVETSEARTGQESLYSSVQKRALTPSSGARPQLSRPGSSNGQRPRADSESEAELAGLTEYYHQRNGRAHGSSNSLDSAGALHGHPASRPITPGFPAVPGTPYFNQSAPSNTLPPRSPMVTSGASRANSRVDLTTRAPSPAGSVYQADTLSHVTTSRRGSVSSEPTEVAPGHVKLVKDKNRFWYMPTITREEAITILRTQLPGTFIVRDSNSFPGAFGLALKVSSPPQNNNSSHKSASDPNSELVRHFLIEPTAKGVRLKGYTNEPVFASLSALIYQHTATALALPTRLVLPQVELGTGEREGTSSATAAMQQLLQLGAACNVFYLFSMDTDQLTGPAAVRKTVSQLFLTRPLPAATVVHFKVSGQGITLTDQARKLFFRKHYGTGQISHCGVDPEDRRWSIKTDSSAPALSNKLFAFVARKATSRNCNQCHVFAELDSDQPARAIVNFVNKVMLSGAGGAVRGGGDMV